LETVENLTKAGHSVEKIEFPFEKVAWCYIKLMSAEGGMRGFIDGLEGEALHPVYSFIYHIASLPNAIRPLISTFLRAVNKNRQADLLTNANKKTTYEYWAAFAELKLLKEQLIHKWSDMQLDCVLCPSGGTPAFPHGMSGKLSQGCSYFFIWNALPFPAGSVPVTTVKDDEEVYSGPADDITAAAKICMKGSGGLPVGVQVVGLPFHDELCLRGMKAVEDATKTH